MANRPQIPPVDQLTMSVAMGSIVMGIVVSLLESWIFGVIVSILTVLLGEVLRIEYMTREKDAFSQTLAGFDWLADFIDELVDSANSVVRDENAPVLIAEFQRVLMATATQVQDLSHGRIVRPTTSARDLIEETMRAMKSLDAVTCITFSELSRGVSWFGTPYGENYWNSNVNALARKVRIRRVFVLDQESEEATRIMEQQARAGVEVSWVLAKHVEPGNQWNVAIWDDKVGWRAQANPSGTTVENVVFVDRSEVQRISRVFGSCLLVARRFALSPKPELDNE